MWDYSFSLHFARPQPHNTQTPPHTNPHTPTTSQHTKTQTNRTTNQPQQEEARCSLLALAADVQAPWRANTSFLPPLSCLRCCCAWIRRLRSPRTSNIVTFPLHAQQAVPCDNSLQHGVVMVSWWLTSQVCALPERLVGSPFFFSFHVPDPAFPPPPLFFLLLLFFSSSSSFFPPPPLPLFSCFWLFVQTGSGSCPASLSALAQSISLKPPVPLTRRISKLPRASTAPTMLVRGPHCCSMRNALAACVPLCC